MRRFLKMYAASMPSRATGLLAMKEGWMHFVAFWYRGSVLRIISFRKANKKR